MVNKSKFVFSIIFILTFAKLYPQDFFIELEPEKNSILPEGYYISSVIDGTNDERNIGLVYADDSLKRKQITFLNGIEFEFDRYFKNSQLVYDSAVPILLRVVYINVQEKATTKKYGRAEVSLEFYRIENDKVAKVFQTNAFAEDYSSDVSASHEKRIKKATYRCLVSFENSDWKKEKQLNWISVKELNEQVLVNEISDSRAKKDIDLKVSTDILNIHYSIGTKTEGLHLQYLIYSDTISVGQWFIPASYSFSAYVVNTKIMHNFDYQSMDNWSFGVLLPFTKKIGERMLLSLQGGIGFGAENLMGIDDNLTTRFIFTTYSNQLLMFVPKKKVGINFGAGLYQNFITSKIYNWDLGVKLLIGMKF
mgnify:CR=1 FL=1